MSLSQKAQHLLDRLVEQVKKDEGRIWGFTCTVENGEVVMQPFSSHNDPAEKFVEMTAAASQMMLEAEYPKEGTHAIN